MLDQNQRTIMVVDDDSIHTFILEKFFAQYLSRPCKVFNNPVRAMEYLKDLDPDSFPELLFLDIKMPLMNGFQFIEEFESRWKASEMNCKLVVLTSSLLESDRERALSHSGVNNFLTKPLSFNALEEIVGSEST